MINDIVKNKYIRATSDEHGKRIIEFLVENGGRNPYNLKGLNGFSYYITSKGSAESFRDNRPIGYTEMHLPSDEPKDELKRGDIVEVSDDGVTWFESIFIANIEGAKFQFVCVSQDYKAEFNSGDSFGITPWKHCRKVETITRKEAEKQLGKKIVG